MPHAGKDLYAFRLDYDVLFPKYNLLLHLVEYKQYVTPLCCQLFSLQSKSNRPFIFRIVTLSSLKPLTLSVGEAHEQGHSKSWPTTKISQPIPTRGLRCGSATARLLGLHVLIHCCQVEFSATGRSSSGRFPRSVWCVGSECDQGQQ